MRHFFTRKRIIWTVVLVLIIGGIGYGVFGREKAPNVQTEVAKRQNLIQTVLTTGQVVSSVDLDLSFQTAGVIRQIHVKEGDVVKVDQVLAILDQSAARASLTSAAGALAQSRANYDKVVAGSTNQQIEIGRAAVLVAQVALDNAKRSYEQIKSQYSLATANAARTLFNSDVEAVSGPANVAPTTGPTISGVYNGTQEGRYLIRLYQGGAGLRYMVTGLETAEGQLVTGAPIPLGVRGLFMQFPSTTVFYNGDQWTVDIPNARASTYLTNDNAYKAAKQAEAQALAGAQNTIDAAQSSLAQAQANMNQTLARATAADLAIARAQILSAQGQVLAAQTTLNNTILKAPAQGTITRIDLKVGEQASALQAVMGLQNVGDLFVEANVSEANVAVLKVGQTVEYTFDAFGPDRIVKGMVQSINPASTVVSGVVNYKVRAKIDSPADLKPGMTANMTILIAQKDNVLSVPSRAILNQNGKQQVRLVDDPKKKTYHAVDVQTGLSADGGLVEILSGVNEGQEIVTYVGQ